MSGMMIVQESKKQRCGCEIEREEEGICDRS